MLLSYCSIIFGYWTLTRTPALTKNLNENSEALAFCLWPAEPSSARRLSNQFNKNAPNFNIYNQVLLSNFPSIDFFDLPVSRPELSLLLYLELSSLSLSYMNRLEPYWNSFDQSLLFACLTCPMQFFFTLHLQGHLMIWKAYCYYSKYICILGRRKKEKVGRR